MSVKIAFETFARRGRKSGSRIVSADWLRSTSPGQPNLADTLAKAVNDHLNRAGSTISRRRPTRSRSRLKT